MGKKVKQTPHKCLFKNGECKGGEEHEGWVVTREKSVVTQEDLLKIKWAELRQAEQKLNDKEKELQKSVVQEDLNELDRRIVVAWKTMKEVENEFLLSKFGVTKNNPEVHRTKFYPTFTPGVF